MDPTHFLTGQVIQHHHAEKANPDEIEGFYDRHGSKFFATMSRWRVRLIKARLPVHGHQYRQTCFAPAPHRG